MNAESEMNTSDGLGGERPITMQDQMGEAGGNAANLDPCSQIAERVGYLGGREDVEALVAYKNALEDRCRSLENTLGQVGHCL